MSDRFVILIHDHPYLHWDLLLERADSLISWRLLSEPATTDPIRAEPLEPHRKHYLDYEGPVSRDRGTVSRWDAGTVEWIEHSPEKVIARLSGSRLQSFASLTLSPETNEWTFMLAEE